MCIWIMNYTYSGDFSVLLKLQNTAIRVVKCLNISILDKCDE
jgi:hypothetical protein